MWFFPGAHNQVKCGLAKILSWSGRVDHQNCSGSSGRLEKAIGGAFERCDIDAFHLDHRLEGALGTGTIGVGNKSRKLSRNNLPRETIMILDPTALLSQQRRTRHFRDIIITP